MAFLGKLLKKKGAEDDLDDDGDLSEWDSSADEPEPDKEKKVDKSRFKVASIKLKDADEDDDEESDDDDDEEEEEEETEDETEASADGDPSGEKKEGDAGSATALMGIFEDEMEVNQQLATLNSWVEDVEAADLVADIRSLLDDLGNP